MNKAVAMQYEIWAFRIFNLISGLLIQENDLNQRFWNKNQQLKE